MSNVFTGASTISMLCVAAVVLFYFQRVSISVMPTVLPSDPLFLIAMREPGPQVCTILFMRSAVGSLTCVGCDSPIRGHSILHSIWGISQHICVQHLHSLASIPIPGTSSVHRIKCKSCHSIPIPISLLGMKQLNILKLITT